MLSSLIALELGDVPLSPPSTASSFTTGLTADAALSQQSIHALSITTAQFGTLWLKLAAHHERKIHVPSPFPDNMEATEIAARVRANAETEVGLYVVEIIGVEFIAAGQLVGKGARGSDAVVLVHAKVSEGGEVDVTARAKAKEAVHLVAEKMKDIFG